MNWQQHRTLAVALRDQGLADCLAARFNNRLESHSLLEHTISLAHVVVAKCQQAVEKVLKGYRLWHSASFDPTQGHSPLADSLVGGSKHEREISRLLRALNQHNRRVVQELLWLERLTPRPPDVPLAERGLPVALERIQENSEYAFWSVTGSPGLVIAAEGLTINNHGRRALTALRIFLQSLAQSDPAEFTLPIRSFLNQYPFSTAVVES